MNLLAAIAWEPEIRGVLVVLIAVVILCGSIYLILATNSGSRLGFLLAFTGLAGWMLIMGAIWTLYGIGWVGESPSWQATEIVVGDLDQAATDRAQDLSDWKSLPEGDGDRGEAQAVVDELFGASGEQAELVSFDGEYVGYVPTAAYAVGGKDVLEDKGACSPHRPGTYDGCWDRFTNKIDQILQFTHPVHYALIQIQRAEPADGETVAEPEADTSAPVISVILTRDIGNKRFTPAMFTLFSGLLFGLGAWQLHRRDLLATAQRAAASV